MHILPLWATDLVNDLFTSLGLFQWTCQLLTAIRHVMHCNDGIVDR